MKVTISDIPTGTIWGGTHLYPEKYAFTGINADGAIPDRCYLIDAKYDGGNQYRENNPPPWVSGNIPDDMRWINTVDGEMLRYRMAVISNSEVSGLISRTNTEASKQFFEAKLTQFGFILYYDAEVEIKAV